MDKERRWRTGTQGTIEETHYRKKENEHDERVYEKTD